MISNVSLTPFQSHFLGCVKAIFANSTVSPTTDEIKEQLGFPRHQSKRLIRLINSMGQWPWPLDLSTLNKPPGEALRKVIQRQTPPTPSRFLKGLSACRRGRPRFPRETRSLLPRRITRYADGWLDAVVAARKARLVAGHSFEVSDVADVMARFSTQLNGGSNDDSS